MDLKFHRSPILHDPAFAKRVFFRVFLFASAISLIPILHILTSYDFKSFHLPKSPPCHASPHSTPDHLPRGSYLFQGHFLNPVWDSFDSLHCQHTVNLTISLIKLLVHEKHLFNHSARALFVGGSSSSAASVLHDLGFSRAVGVDKGRFISLKRMEVGYKLDYPNSSFDFVLFKGKLKVSVPDLVVGELERILDGGGIGAVVTGISSPISIGLGGRVRKLLKSSCVVYSGNVEKLYVSVFKKKSFDDDVPINCSS
ncbi:uncharacterized protein LOC105435880 [Cucumis sativus]|uniref:Methyltransferase type 11 domain-containing protein n=1 Tax=Cucumis sativus TaxID=3659 RepID=A0A0A0KEM7_CUCSA|nr:uncharacterized protein LOC105435880 [Cucumis sativus]